MINTGTIDTGSGFKGRVTVTENGRYLWSECTAPTRLNKADALKDAEQYRKELLNQQVTE